MDVQLSLEDPIKMEALIQVVGLEGGLRVCISNMLPCEAEVVAF